MKTVKQIAEELGVSKQAVHKKRKSKGLETALQPFTTTVDGTVYIAPEGETLLKQAFSKEGDPAPSTVSVNHFTPVDVNVGGGVDGPVDAPEHPLYAVLREELAAKNRLIEELQAELTEERRHSREQADKLAQLADQAQRLHAGDIKAQLPQPGAEEPAAAVDAESAPERPRRTIGEWLRSKFS